MTGGMPPVLALDIPSDEIIPQAPALPKSWSGAANRATSLPPPSLATEDEKNPVIDLETTTGKSDVGSSASATTLSWGAGSSGPGVADAPEAPPAPAAAVHTAAGNDVVPKEAAPAAVPAADVDDLEALFSLFTDSLKGCEGDSALDEAVNAGLNGALSHLTADGGLETGSEGSGVSGKMAEFAEASSSQIKRLDMPS